MDWLKNTALKEMDPRYKVNCPLHIVHLGHIAQVGSSLVLHVRLILTAVEVGLNHVPHAIVVHQVNTM